MSQSSNYAFYINQVENAVHSFIRQLYTYDVNCNIQGHNLYTTKPKVHLLTHLPDDLRRFGAALNYETEKGEQFNKHIQEHLFHTNRLDTSKDICLKFAKQSIMKHILDGGSWVNKDGARVRHGEEIADFLRYNAGKKFFHSLFGGTRDFADNNDTGEIVNGSLRNGSFAAFMGNNGDVFFGVVNGGNIEHFEIVDASSTSFERNFLSARRSLTGQTMAISDSKAMRYYTIF